MALFSTMTDNLERQVYYQGLSPLSRLINGIFRGLSNNSIVMEDLFKCDGRRFSAKIQGIECDGVIGVEGTEIYLCQNKIVGANSKDKKGFKYSWWYKDIDGDTSSFVTDFKLLEEPEEGDLVYVSDCDPECSDKQEAIFLYKTKAGLILCVHTYFHEEYLNNESILVSTWRYMKPIPKNTIVEVPMEEALKIVAKEKGVDVENLRVVKFGVIN